MNKTPHSELISSLFYSIYIVLNYIQVVKNRFSGDLGNLPLYFTKSVLSFNKKVHDQHRRSLKKKTLTIVSDKAGEAVMTEVLIKPD